MSADFYRCDYDAGFGIPDAWREGVDEGVAGVWSNDSRLLRHLRPHFIASRSAYSARIKNRPSPFRMVVPENEAGDSIYK